MGYRAAAAAEMVAVGCWEAAVAAMAAAAPEEVPTGVAEAAAPEAVMDWEAAVAAMAVDWEAAVAAMVVVAAMAVVAMVMAVVAAVAVMDISTRSHEGLGFGRSRRRINVYRTHLTGSRCHRQPPSSRPALLRTGSFLVPPPSGQ